MPTFEKLCRGIERNLLRAPNFNRAISMICAVCPTFMKFDPWTSFLKGALLPTSQRLGNTELCQVIKQQTYSGRDTLFCDSFQMEAKQNTLHPRYTPIFNQKVYCINISTG